MFKVMSIFDTSHAPRTEMVYAVKSVDSGKNTLFLVFRLDKWCWVDSLRYKPYINPQNDNIIEEVDSR